MIVVRVELWSAQDGSHTELARMRICNDGRVTRARDGSVGDYIGETLRGRSEAALDQGVAQRHGKVVGYPRLTLHVWHLVARMLVAMGYAQVASGTEPQDDLFKRVEP